MMPRSHKIISFGALLFTIFVQVNSKVISTSNPSDFVLQETKKWLSKTPQFQNSSSDEETSKAIDGLLSWKTPDYIVKHFSYYVSGLSDEKLPIYVLESGKFDVVALLHQGPGVVKNIDKALAQAFVRAFKTLENGGLDGTNHRVYLILDFEGFKYSHFVSVAAIELLTKLFLQYMPMAQNLVEKIYLVNGNYAVDTLFNMFRPLYGRLAERIEIYGPKKSVWMAVFKREFPLEALPPWYGGYGNFTPIATYG